MKGIWNRRFFALCLALMLCCSCLQGCGSKDAKTPATEEPATPEATEDVKAPEEVAGQEKEEPGTAASDVKPLSDTVRWFNASYAVLTALNNWDYNQFGGMEPSEFNAMLIQKLLNDWWSVTDRASADETLDWILEEGHRVGFVDTMAFLEENGIGDVEADARTAWILENFDVGEEEAQMYANCYGAYQDRGENCIAGWDYCRALNLMSYYYVAGYYTEEEALDKSLEIAQTVQPMFTSWDDLIDSYMIGYEYWAEESSEDRRATYQYLQEQDDNPYTVDYQTTLEKTW